LLDGRELGRAAWGTAAPIDPGEHTLTATARGKKAWSSSFVIGGTAEQKSIVVPALDDVAAEPAPPPEPPPPPPPTTPSPPVATASAPAPTASPPPPPPEPPRVPTHALRYTGFALVGLGVATGSVTGIMALSKGRSNVLPSCDQDARTCPASVGDDLEATRTLATVSTVAFVAAGVGAGLVLADFLVKPSARSSSAGAGVWASVGPAAASFGGTF
jgi:hypothetical protein